MRLFTWPYNPENTGVIGLRNKIITTSQLEFSNQQLSWSEIFTRWTSLQYDKQLAMNLVRLDISQIFKQLRHNIRCRTVQWTVQ